MKRHLISTISGKKYPFDKLEEFSENGESLEVKIDGLDRARLKEGLTVWERFADFLPFDNYTSALSLGEGDTPLLESEKLAGYLGLDSVLLKNETVNPTWSFKDRGSFPCILMAKQLGERFVATISTGNMGASIAAYGARSDIQPIIFIPTSCPEEKIRSMAIHGAIIIKIDAPDFGEMKRRILALSDSFKLRIVSGNGPIRVEGYKFCAFEIYEQLGKKVPDFIAVPTSACGHIRGLFKGFRELLEAQMTDKLPRMIIVQAAENSPLVTAFKQHKIKPVPFSDIHTIAKAITTGNPPGGDEILKNAYKHHWLAEDVTEEEILMGQRILGQMGFFVEPSAATSLLAVKKLCDAGKIKRHESVVLMLTGSGLKDSEVFRHHQVHIINSSVSTIENDLQQVLSREMS
ncbi:MAG: threonine synthase [Candidatus Rhabdochlamydia sp.]